MNNPKPEHILILERTVNAPRELVFQTWLDPKHLAQWWGPKDFTNPICEVDARPGGMIRITMQAPDGTLIPTEGIFLEIAPHERIVFSNQAFKNAAGEPQLETLNTVTLAEANGKTKLTVQAIVTKAGPSVAVSLASMNEGWQESLDRLETVIARTI
jgi:uncharacterized protein YndB with AHSA1/START domain